MTFNFLCYTDELPHINYRRRLSGEEIMFSIVNVNSHKKVVNKLKDTILEKQSIKNIRENHNQKSR